MIPHIIHLCWFGKGKYPELAQMCIDSWKRFLPNYTIMIWNEDSFDVQSVQYTKEAYEQKKWAFVSDYVRLYALEQYGGVYMDTDLEVIKDFSGLLEDHSFVSSTLEGGLITAGFIAAVAHHPYIVELKSKYENGFFVREDGTIEFSMNPLLFTRVAREMYGFIVNNDGNQGKSEFAIYSLDYFMPYRISLFRKNPYRHENYQVTNNTYAIHHDMGSWGHESRFSWWKRAIAREVIPRKIYLYLKKIKYQKVFM